MDTENSQPKLPSVDVESSIASRTRSGRGSRVAAAEVKTPTRRTRKSVIQNSCSGGSGTDTVPEPEPPVKRSKVEGCGLPNGPLSAELLVPDPLVSAGSGQTRETSAVADKANEKENRGGKKSAGHARQSIPMGKPKSGRIWKDRNKQRFSALLRDKPLRTSWEKKMQAKREKALVKQYHMQLKEGKAREKQEKRKRREENLQRKAENERKSEIVQVIKNTAKIKRMKKKQLRKIEKRDTLSMLQKSQHNGKAN
ncbi:coiled-coil domain-containing protein 86 [Denticeps clupeoides]|nr:coiled-coil domain-containing protein 86 [Denticeps clupeoides]